MRSFSRRNFFKIAGVAAAGAAGVGLGQARSPLPEIGQGDPWPDREEHWVASVCQFCPGGCGVRARVVDGRVVKVEGNPFHPVNRGRLCPVGQAAPQFLYHPDRLRAPMVRDGGGSLRPASWGEAIALVARKLQALRGQQEAHTMVFLTGTYRGLRERFLRRFMSALGSPNYVRAGEIFAEEADLAHVLTQGVDRPLAPDLFSARSILSFGVPLLEGGPSPVYQMRAYGHFRHGEDRPRGFLLQVEARRSATAERADRWVAIRPGTEATLAMGIAHAIILEQLYDADFVETYSEGFNDTPGRDGQVVPGFRSIVLREFTLPRVSEATGVPSQTILSIARAFAKNQPGVAIAPSGPPAGPSRLGLRLAVHYLNVLVGNLGKAGGLLLPGRLPLGEWEARAEDEIGRASLAQPRLDGARSGVYALAGNASEALPERILSGKPYPVNALLVAGIDPLFDHPWAKDFTRVLDRVPFVVSFSSMPDMISRKAHVVLPDAMYLERWTEDAVAHLAGFTALSLGQPVLRSSDSPLALEETLLKVAQAMGGVMAESFKWGTFADAIFEAVAPLSEAGRGYVAADPIIERFRMILARQGYWQKEFKEAKEFRDALLKNGSWWEPGEGVQGVVAQIFHPDRKFRFFPGQLESLFAGFGSQARQAAERSFGMRTFGPHLFPADPPRPQRAKEEFELVMFRPMALVSAVSAELPWLQEQLGFHVNGRWESWVEVHPEDAKRLGLRDHDAVELRSKRGSLRTKVRIFSGVRQGTVAMPIGMGSEQGGQWARGRGADPRRLAAAETDPIQGMGIMDSPLVRIRRIS